MGILSFWRLFQWVNVNSVFLSILLFPPEWIWILESQRRLVLYFAYFYSLVANFQVFVDVGQVYFDI
jgi:hypothetical protein